MLGSGFHCLLVTTVLNSDSCLEQIASTLIKRHHLVQSGQLTSRFMRFLASRWIAKDAVEKDYNVIVDKHITFHKIFRDETEWGDQ